MLNRLFGLFSHDIAIDLGTLLRDTALRKLPIRPFRKPVATAGQATIKDYHA